MPDKASYKSKGGKKDSAAKRTMNQPIPGTENVSDEPNVPEPEQQDPKRRIGQYQGAGEPPIMKR